MRFPTGRGPRRADSGPAARPRAELEADHTARTVLENRAGHQPHAEVPQTGTPASVPGVGRPLDPARRAFFERGLGADLSAVRVHDDAAAARAARDQHAAAYTYGEHVVLGVEADHAVLAHELVHVLQQRRAGRVAVQRQDRERTGGIGRTPPKVDFDVVRERAPAEDTRLLFPHDSLSPVVLDLSTLLPRLGTTRPLIVDIDGYASTEGDPEYNVNLSAHRAAAIRAVLIPLLPEGSTVRLHAHGATAEFGDPAANRRVGIRVTEAPVQLVPPLVTPGPRFGLGPRLLPDLELRLDPRLFPRQPGVSPPIPDVRLRDPATGEPYELDRPGGIFPPRVTVPPPPVPVRPPDLFPWLLPPPATVVDWGALRQTFVDHGAGPIDPRLAEAAEGFTKDWYLRYRAIGIPEDRARWLANAGTRSLVGRELAREGNTAADRLDNELRREGLPTPVIQSIDLLDLLRRKRKDKGSER